MNQLVGILLSGLLLTSSVSTPSGQYSCTVQVEVDESETSGNKNTNNENNKDSKNISKEASSDKKNKNILSDEDLASTKEEIKTIIIPKKNVIVPPAFIPPTIKESSSSSNENSSASSSHRSSSSSSDKKESLDEVTNQLPIEEEIPANTNASTPTTSNDASKEPTEILVDEITVDMDSSTEIEKFHFLDTVRMGLRNVTNFGTLTFGKIAHTVRTYIKDEPVISCTSLVLLIVCIPVSIKLISKYKNKR